MAFETSDPDVRKRLDTLIEQNKQIATLLNKILTALERQNGKSEGANRPARSYPKASDILKW